MNNKRHNGFTLVEVLIVVVIMAVLAATIIPQFTDSSKDAKVSAVKFNLHTLRSQIELYKAQHDGTPPGNDLAEMLLTTNAAGTTNTADGPLFYGPYIPKIPKNPFNNSDVVLEITNNPAAAADVTAGDGWLYNKSVGQIWINHADYYTE